MNKSITRAISGIIYIFLICLGTLYSKLSFTLLFLFLGIISLYEMNKLRKEKEKTLPFLYIIIPFTTIHFLTNSNVGNTEESFNTDLILFLFILTWTFDTFAYIFGSKLGKHKIIPSISPKKSWEGFAGGFFFTFIAFLITTKYFQSVDSSIALVISLFLPFTATLGDFIESYYKRQAGVKDSGNFIPGHGGILDRMDAFMITIPVLYIYLQII